MTPVSEGRARVVAPSVLLVISCGVLALALSETFGEWVLFSETLLRRFLFGA